MKLPKIFLPEKDLEGKIEGLLKEPLNVQPKYTKFEVISAKNYAKGIAKLKEQDLKPFTFSENIGARIADYKANDKDAELFKTYLDSVTGIAYKADSTKFKLILRCSRLENIESDFNQNFIPVDYNAENGIELDSAKGKYDQLLTREEVKNHEFWLAAMDGGKERLAKYVDLWFDKRGVEEGMGVYLRSNTSQDELRAIALLSDYDNSDAVGYYGLHDDARFLSGAQ